MAKSSKKEVGTILTGKTYALPVIQEINKFVSFCDNEILPVVPQLERMRSARVHLQKLVYAHVVDKFDLLVDQMLLWSATHLEVARGEILLAMSNTPITTKRVYELFLSGLQARELIEEEIVENSRVEYSKDNHENKVRKLTDYVHWAEATKQLRVNTNGKISDKPLKRTSIQKNTPSSVVGFAYYLFARRSGISHGDSRKFTEKDKVAMEKNYHIKLTSFIIKPASIKTAVTFYKGFLEHVKDRF
jgi:hypothetical protein